MPVPVRAWLVAGAMVLAQAQGPPDLSGSWTIVPERSIWYDDGRPVHMTVFGRGFTVTQTADVLTVTIENEGGFRWTYRLDGSISRNLPPGPEGPYPTSSTTTWSDRSLTIQTTGIVTGEGQAETQRTRRTLTLQPDDTLRVEAPWGRNGEMIGSTYARVP